MHKRGGDAEPTLHNFPDNLISCTVTARIAVELRRWIVELESASAPTTPAVGGDTSVLATGWNIQSNTNCAF